MGAVGSVLPDRVLLDTHALLWWLFDDPRLSERARDVIRSADTAVLVSSASGWEIGTKYRLGRLPEATEVVHNLPPLLRRSRMEVLPIALEHALAAGMLPGPHRDPFDRTLIAQAGLERLPIVTNDPVFARYEVEVVW